MQLIATVCQVSGRPLTVKDSPGERKPVGRVAPGSVSVELIETQVDPADDQAAAEHGAVGALHEADGPHDEREPEDRERDVSVGDLAEGRPVQHVVGHRLLHRNRNSGQVSGKTWQIKAVILGSGGSASGRVMASYPSRPG